jgi:hypothetical protein
MSTALPKNLIEFLQFIPPCRSVERMENGDWLLRTIDLMDTETQDGLKLRFGYRSGTVTRDRIVIDRTMLWK